MQANPQTEWEKREAARITWEKERARQLACQHREAEHRRRCKLMGDDF